MASEAGGGAISRRAATLLLLAAGLTVGWLTPPQRIADASPYVMMADSLWHDGDLAYAPEDYARTRVMQFQDLPVGLMLLEHGDGWLYAKPLLYPLVALPFYAVFGVQGFMVLNGLLCAVLLLLGADIAAPRLGWRAGLLAALVVFGGSVTFVYRFWIDPFLLLTCLAAVAVASWQRRRPGACAAAIALMAAVRFPYLALVVAPVGLALHARQWRALVRFALVGLLVAGGALLATRLATDQWSPYTGQRHYFGSDVPYRTAATPAGFAASRDVAFEARALPAVADVAQGLSNFVFGRFGGILLYFPTFFACAFWVRRWTADKVAWPLAVAAFALTLVVVIPHNSLGGEHAVGNRFFVVLPAALVLIDSIGWQPWRLLPTALLVLLAVPVIQAPQEFSRGPGRQMVLAPYRWFPFEWPLVRHVYFPGRFGDLHALTDNQYYWEPDPGGVWTMGGRTAEFVITRRADRPVTVQLWSLLPEAEIADGGVAQTIPFDGQRRSITLSHPMAMVRDEYGGADEPLLAVYWLTVTTPHGVTKGEDPRYLGVFVQLLPPAEE
ncbi:MAG: hypothetical protein ACRERC_25430 [Candidatus Binatia bacterium]